MGKAVVQWHPATDKKLFRHRILGNRLRPRQSITERDRREISQRGGQILHHAGDATLSDLRHVLAFVVYIPDGNSHESAPP